MGGALAGRRGICRGRDTGLAQGVEVGGPGGVSIWGGENGEWLLTCENRALKELYELVNLYEHIDRHFEVCENLEKVVGLLVGLCEETEREGGHGVVAPCSEQGNEKCLSVSALRVA